jgi:predicted GTPase
MSYILDGYIRKRDLAKLEVKVCEAKIRLYSDLEKLEFYDRWIDRYIDKAEYAPQEVIQSLRSEITSAELKTVKPKVQAVYKAMQAYYKLRN